MGTYSFNDVNVSITGPGGSFSIGGNGSGNAEEGITIAMTEDKNTMTIGADGTPQHSLHAGKSGHLTVRLLKTSPVNSQLSSLYNTQVVSSALHGQNIVSIRNPITGDSITATNVAFKKLPDVVYAKEAGMQEWAFDCGIISTVLGSGGTVAAAAALVQQSV
jgi:hypothetical protein